MKSKIFVDHREKNSLVASELMKKGNRLEFVQLHVGDYIVKNIVVERKAISDLKSSIINKRIFKQLKELQQCKQRLLIIEGFNQTSYQGKMHENALRGFLLSTVQRSQVPVIYSTNEKDTAQYLDLLTKNKSNKTDSLRASKIIPSDKERIQYILEGFPNIGPIAAQKLIETFHTLEAIIQAPEKELEKILGKRTQEFKRLITLKINQER